MRRAAIYTRVSSNIRRGEAYEQNPEVQEMPLRQVAAAREWEVVDYQTDRVTAAQETRPGLSALLAAARQGKYDVLMVWRLDRAFRNARHCLVTVDELRALGVDFYSLQESFDSTVPMGRFGMTILAAVAELERNLIRERVIAGLEFARAHGTKSGRAIGRPKAVFRRDQALELRAAGKSYRAIAAELGVGEATVRRVCGQ